MRFDCLRADWGGRLRLLRRTRYDIWRVPGSAGQLIEATLTPLDASYTNASIEFRTPAGDASKTPLVTGSGALKARYVLSSTGTWTIYVGTFDVPAGGRYSLSLQCLINPSPASPQNCVTQNLACGQSSIWSLTATSCRFSSGELYAFYSLGRLNAGDTATIRAASDSFDPAAALYRGGGSPVASGFGARFTRDATVIYTAPTAGDYQVAVLGQAVNAAGEFFVDVDCVAAPCFSTASIRTQPADAKVLIGSGVSLQVDATGNGPLAYQWFESDLQSGVSNAAPNGTGATLSIPLVSTQRAFWVRVTNGCAHVDSRVATVAPLQRSHPRAVKR
jgi:hypothetical protein